VSTSSTTNFLACWGAPEIQRIYGNARAVGRQVEKKYEGFEKTIYFQASLSSKSIIQNMGFG